MNALKTAWKFVTRNDKALVGFIAIVITALDLLGVASTEITLPAILAALGALLLTSQRDRAKASSEADSIRNELRSIGLVRVVGSSEIRRELDLELQEAMSWMFKGGSGSFIRNGVVQRLQDSATRSRAAATLQVELIDPTDPDGLSAYCDYRRQAERDNRHFDKDDMMQEILRTIVELTWWNFNSLVDISICLNSSIPALRYDIGPKTAFITSAGPHLPALVVQDQTLRHAYVEELRLSFKTGTVLDIEKATSGTPRGPLSKITAEAVRSIAVGVGLGDLIQGATDEQIEAVAEEIRKGNS